MNKHVIVVGNDHYNPLSVIRSLGKVGYKPILIVINPHNCRSYISKSKYVDTYHSVDNESQLADFLMHLPLPERTAVIACSDRVAAILDEYYNELSLKYYIPNCRHTQGVLTTWMDKKKQQDAAKRAGLRVLDGKVLRTDFLNTETISAIEFPCVVKPLSSNKATKDNFRICKDIKSLKNAINEISGDCKEVIVQKYLTRDYEFNILGCRIKEDNKCFHPGGYYRMKACNSLNNMGMPCFGYVNSQIHPDINMEAWQHFIDEVDYEGLFSTEFLIAGDKAYFLEINLRNDGDLFLWTKAGANLPATWVNILYGEENNAGEDCRFVKENVYGMNGINYLKYSVSPITIVQNFKEWLKCSCYTILDWHDIKPFFYKIIYSLSK